MGKVDTSAEAVELLIQRCWMIDTDPECNEAMLRALAAERDALKAQLSTAREEALEAADKLGFHCIGCGRLCGDPEKDLKWIRKAGGVSCCPEREMKPLSEAIRALITPPTKGE